jgi:hypothetical protein
MRIKTFIALMLGLLSASMDAAPLGTAFTYQGRLSDGSGSAANGNYDLRFFLFDVPSAGTAIAGPITNSNVGLSSGLFSVTLDFGEGVFDGQARWLQIGVRTNGAASFTPLLPRQPVSPSPYAVYAATVRLTNGAVDSAQIANGAITSLKLASNAVTTARIADFAVDTAQLANGAVTSAKLASNAVTSLKVADGTLVPADLDVERFNTTFWRTAGNSNTTAGTHFLGTSDNTPFEIHVNGQRALRIVPRTNGEPNVIAGSPANSVSAGTTGATIAGGGSSSHAPFGFPAPNTVSGDHSTIGGGVLNRTFAEYATISGGTDNESSGSGATVPGGIGNTAGGAVSFAAGFMAKADHDRSFVWAGGNTAEFPSETADRFHVYAQQGLQVEFGGQTSAGRGNNWVVIGSGNAPTRHINTSSGGYLSSGGTWVSSSDRNKKENFAPVDTRAILEKVAALPLSTWNYKCEDASSKHLGPMAQDFRAAFGLGHDEKGIGTVDADGVALAAIQGLNQKVEEQARALRAKDGEIQSLQQRLTRLEELLSRKD